MFTEKVKDLLLTKQESGSRPEPTRMSVKSQEALKEFMKASPVIESTTDVDVTTSGLNPDASKKQDKDIKKSGKLPPSRLIKSLWKNLRTSNLNLIHAFVKTDQTCLINRTVEIE